MGIPKFFQYISERYPCLTEKLKDYQIPEFDNLYLDVNGIIHGCSHPDDTNVLFRITEETIFNNIFRYIELLFRMIQPQKLFFVAIDGVAPRAKINQQRSRRFRAAKDAEIQELKAKTKGISLPTEKRFDSNCITPGTLFMAKLDEQLKYFITYKISTDKLWQKCKVMFSGSQVPGEGEHKIMDYIRYMKSQPDYDIHTKHCLYGLDADLIMLGLCTHEVHFTLLREEVTFGKKHLKVLLTPEETKFCLFHLSLLREYIDHEFSSLKEKLAFPYDLEKIIDDWVLMGFLIGNDFIPHLPNLHIVHGALSVLYQVYMDVLPTLDGYINETGTLRLDRFEKFMERLSRFDILRFSDHYADIKYLESKTGKPLPETERANNLKSESSDETPSPKRVQQDKEFDALLRSAMESGKECDEEGGDDDSDPEIYAMEFVQRKKDYYINKLNYETIDEDFLRSQAEGYVRAIQWNLNYYYNGCCSWSWYYPHHYAPYISDIKDFKDLKLEFDIGEPFLPFEQLLAALPPYSKSLLPSAFQSLLTEEQSPIKNYYPLDFETDLNGKQQEWEAVVLIPFIDEKHLLDAIATRHSQLTTEERMRNRHGPMCLFTYTEENLGVYKAPEYFPDVVSHARVQLINREDIIVPRDKLVRGLCPGVELDVYYPGFPTLRHIEHTVTLEKAKVKVHQRQSLRDSMVLHITSPPQTSLTTLGQKLLGNTVFVNWPHMKEAVVVAVSNDHAKLNLVNSEVAVAKESEESVSDDMWNAVKKRITDTYKGHLAVEIGPTKFLVHVRLLLGKKHTFGTHGNMRIEKQWSELPAAYAYQTVVKDIVVRSSDVALFNSIDEVFVPGTTCFMLGHPYYGALAKVCESGVCKTSGRVKVSVLTVREPPFEVIKQLQSSFFNQYVTGSLAAQKLGISSLLLSRVTGTIFVKPSSDGVKQDDSTHNIGLNLKFTKRNAEILGYTRKTEDGHWFYSPKAIELIRNYMLKYPVLFERLAQNPSACIFQEEDLFAKGTNELSETVAWLKDQLQGTEIRTCGTMTVESPIVKKLEEQIDAYVNSQDSAGKAVEMQVQPYLLYVPGLHLRNLPPDPKTHTVLLDRVCCTKDNFTVPLGYKGTVIGIQKMEAADTMYDVLFDKTFVGGLSINGSSELRAYRLSALDFININHGDRIAHSKATLDGSMEPTEVRKSGHESQRRANASAFASYRNENHFGTDAPMSPRPRIVQKNAEGTGQIQRYRYNAQNVQVVNAFREPYRVRNPLPPPPVLPSPNLQKKSSTEPTSEFQAIWNELHKKQEPNDLVQKTPLPPKVKHDKGFPGNPAPQDPSAFLKAVLKISDGNAQQTAQQTAQKPVQKVAQQTVQKAGQKAAQQPVQKLAQQPVQKLGQQPMQQFAQQPVQHFPQPGTSKAPRRTNSVQKENKALDNTPPLVQQLFDHARQNEKAKDDKTPIWYCSQLLNYHQLSGVGMPRYSYFADPETKLIQAHILLPDKRVFVGDSCVNHEQAAGSAAKKVYTELNLATVLPNMKILLPPQHWYSNAQNTNWSQNVRPPAPGSFYPPESTLLQTFPEWVQKGHHNTGHQHTSKQNDQYNNHYNRPKPSIPKEPKPGMSAKSNLGMNPGANPGSKNFPAFVPLQAIKKSRNVMAKQSANKEATTQSAKDNPRPVAKPKNTESQTQAKATKVEATSSSGCGKEKSVQNGSNETQTTQRTFVIKPKKSRVAAKFNLQTQTEEKDHSKSSSST